MSDSRKRSQASAQLAKKKSLEKPSYFTHLRREVDCGGTSSCAFLRIKKNSRKSHKAEKRSRPPLHGRMYA